MAPRILHFSAAICGGALKSKYPTSVCKGVVTLNTYYIEASLQAEA